jgi:hypothetical protein
MAVEAWFLEAAFTEVPVQEQYFDHSRMDIHTSGTTQDMKYNFEGVWQIPNISMVQFLLSSHVAGLCNLYNHALSQ